MPSAGSMTVGALKLLAERLFKVKAARQVLALRLPGEEGTRELGKDDTQVLAFFNVEVRFRQAGFTPPHHHRHVINQSIKDNINVWAVVHYSCWVKCHHIGQLLVPPSSHRSGHFPDVLVHRKSSRGTYLACSQF